MESLDINQLWRQVPPEEKFEIMASAHSRGISTSAMAIVLGATLAICLKQPWMLWGSILISPVVFQGASAKAWKHLKPRVILEYLAARSAARRFAFSLNSSRLGVSSIIKGNLSEVRPQDKDSEDINSADDEYLPSHNSEKEVWIALFHDALVIISEQAGGARLELGQHLAKNIEVSGDSPTGQGDYATDREVYIKVTGNSGLQRQVRLTSRYPAALVVLEKKLLKLIEEAKNARNLLENFKIPMPAEVEDEFMSFNLN